MPLLVDEGGELLDDAHDHAQAHEHSPDESPPSSVGVGADVGLSGGSLDKCPQVTRWRPILRAYGLTWQGLEPWSWWNCDPILPSQEWDWKTSTYSRRACSRPCQPTVYSLRSLWTQVPIRGILRLLAT